MFDDAVSLDVGLDLLQSVSALPLSRLTGLVPVLPALVVGLQILLPLLWQASRIEAPSAATSPLASFREERGQQASQERAIALSRMPSSHVARCSRLVCTATGPSDWLT